MLRVLFVNLASQPCGPGASSVVLSAAVHRQNGLKNRVHCSYLDALNCGDEPESLFWRIEAEEAHVVCFSCYIWNINAIELLTLQLERISPSVRIAIGGPAAQMISEEVSESVWICRSGTGENAFVEWLSQILAVTPNFDDPMLCRPYLDRDDAYVSSPATKGMVVYDAARGCPFTCSFCFDGQHERAPVHRPAEVVLAEMRHLAKIGYETIDVSDNNANLVPSLFAAYIAVANEFPSTVVHTEVRAELFDRHSAVEAASFSNLQMFMGVQSALPNETLNVSRRNSVDKLTVLLRDWIPLPERRASVGLELMFGLPEQTLASFGSSFDFVAGLQPNKISLYHYQRFPWDHSPLRFPYKVLPPEFRNQVASTPTMSVTDISWCRKFKRVFYTLQATGEWSTVANVSLSKHGLSPFEFYSAVLAKCDVSPSRLDILRAGISVASRWFEAPLVQALEENMNEVAKSVTYGLSPLWNRSSTLLQRYLSGDC